MERDMQPSTMISDVGEARRLLDSYYRRLDRTISAFAAGFAVAFVMAIFINYIIRRLRQYFFEPEQQHHHPSVVSSAGECRGEHTVAIPVLVYDSGTSSSGGDQICAICLEEFETGESVSVLPRCKHMFHKDCIKEWAPAKSVNCPICRVPMVESDGCQGRRRNGGVANPPLSSAFFVRNSSRSGTPTSSHPATSLRL